MTLKESDPPPIGVVIPIAAGPELLQVPRALPTGDVERHHRKLAAMVAGHACLVFANAEEAIRLARALGTLADENRKVWDAALTVARTRLCDLKPIPTPISEIEALSREDFDIWSRWAGLACIDEDAIDALGDKRVIPSSSVSLGAHPFVFDRPPPLRALHAVAPLRVDLNQFDPLEAAVDLGRRQTVPGGTHRDSIRDLYLAPLLRYAVRVAVIDRYLGENLLRHDQTEKGVAGFEWFLDIVQRNTWVRKTEEGDRTKLTYRGAAVAVYTTLPNRHFERDLQALVKVFDGIVKRLASVARVGADGRRADGLHEIVLFCAKLFREDGVKRVEKTRVIEIGHGSRDSKHGRLVDVHLRDAATYLWMDRGLDVFGYIYSPKTFAFGYTPRTLGNDWKARSREVEDIVDALTAFEVKRWPVAANQPK